MDFLSFFGQLGILTVLYFSIWQVFAYLINKFFTGVLRIQFSVILVHMFGMFLYSYISAKITQYETQNVSMALEVLAYAICIIVVIVSSYARIKDKAKQELTVLEPPAHEIFWEYAITYFGALFIVVMAFLPKFEINFISSNYNLFYMWLKGESVLYWIAWSLGALVILVAASKVLLILKQLVFSFFRNEN